MARRQFSSSVQLADAAAPVRVRHPFLRTGVFTDPRYGEFRITPAMLEKGKANFEAGILARQITLDVAHEPDDGAAAIIKKLTLEPFTPPTPELAAKYRAAGIAPLVLMAELEFTDYGQSAVKEKGFRYISAEYDEDWMDNETGIRHGVVILGGGLTTRPVQRHQPALQLSEDQASGDAPVLFFNETGEKPMNEIDKLKERLRKDLETLGLYRQIAEMMLNLFYTQATQLGEAERDSVKLQQLADHYFDEGKKTMQEIKAGLDAAKQTINVTLSEAQQAAPATPAAPALGEADITAIVAKKLAEAKQAEADAARQLAETTQSKRKLFSEIIKAKQLGEHEAAALADLDSITPDMPDGVVKTLAEKAAENAQLRHHVAAADFLKARGFEPNTGVGMGRVEMSHQNQVMELMEALQKGYGLSDMPPAIRFKRTEGHQFDANKRLSEKILARVAREHEGELYREWEGMKKLQQGVKQAMSRGYQLSEADIRRLATTDTSDSSIPISYQALIVTEAAYKQRGPMLCLSGVEDKFAAVYQEGYSYRDTTTKISDFEVYEGGAIPNFSIKTGLQEVRPRPSKGAMELTDEYLKALSGVWQNFDPQNSHAVLLSQILAEINDQRIEHEMVRASDYYSTVTLSAVEVLNATIDGTNNVFKIITGSSADAAFYPICRPEKIYDMAGVQVGSTVHPVVIEYDSTGSAGWTALTEWSAGVSAGTYYRLDYNYSELRIVNEAGVTQTPVAAAKIRYTCDYSTNAVTFDMKTGTGYTDDLWWDKAMLLIGDRKATLSDDRYYSADTIIGSEKLMNLLSQAKSFGSDGSRLGNALTPDGSIGNIKGLPAYNLSAPGTALSYTISGKVQPQRLIITQKQLTRFKVASPWEMGELENVRNGSGLFTGKKQAYGAQWNTIWTPEEYRAGFTSVIFYNSDNHHKDRAE